MKQNDTTVKQLASINQLKAVLDYVRSHYAEPVTLKELADIACMSQPILPLFPSGDGEDALRLSERIPYQKSRHPSRW